MRYPTLSDPRTLVDMNRHGYTTGLMAWCEARQLPSTREVSSNPFKDLKAIQGVAVPCTHDGVLDDDVLELLEKAPT